MLVVVLLVVLVFFLVAFLVVLVFFLVVLLVVLVFFFVALFVVLPLLVVLVRLAWLAVIVWVMVVGTIVVLGILVVYVVYVCIVVPTDGVVEVVSLLEPLPLFGVKHALDLLVAIVPSIGVDVAIAAYAVEIVEVDVHETVALNVAQSQFHNHLVGDEASLRLNICKSLCIS